MSYNFNDNYTPRPTKEIYDLRRQGQLDQAKHLAEEILRQDNTDQDVWKAYAWTLIDICKREQKQGNIEGARQISDELSNLQFDTTYDEFAETLLRNIQFLKLTLNPYYAQIKEAKELSKNGNNDQAWVIMSQLAAADNLPLEAHENYGWIIYKYLRDHLTALNSVQVRTLLRDYINLNNERPSVLHSQILNFALNYSKQDDNFNLISFLRLWGPNNLRVEDFDESRGDDGKPIPSLMSRIARAIVNYPYLDIMTFVNLIPWHNDDFTDGLPVPAAIPSARNLYSRHKDDFIDMLREHFFWNLYHSTEGGTDSSTWELFEHYLDFFPESKASVWHSKVLSLAERVMKGNNAIRFYDFFRKWNPSKLRALDWQEEQGDNGVIYKPLAIRSLKKAHEALDMLPEEKIDDIQWLIDLYGTAIEKFPDDDWNIRSKALLHLRAGQLAKAMSIYKNLCLKMGDKYYIWSEFANCWKDNSVKIALLCKAISLEKNEDYIGKVRLELARQLIEVRKYDNAAIELNLYKKHYTDMGWRIDAEVDSLIQQCSSNGSTLKDNEVLYAENIPIAEEYAYVDIPFTEVVLVDKWKNDDGKELMFFVDGNAIEFTTTRKRFPALCGSHKGQVWKFKIYKDETTKTIPSLYAWRPPTTETIVKYIPLIAVPSDKEDWLCLPVNYGYVQHVNEEKKVYHIYSTESILFYEHYDNQTFKKGDYLVFRQYKKKNKDGDKVVFCGIRKCDEFEALEHFKSRIVGVDEVNESKQLFHFVLGPKLISGLLHYNETELRPVVGDCIKIYYFVREKDDKKNPGHQKKVIEVIKSEATKEINTDAIKTISGTLELHYKDSYGNSDPDFAFIGDYYVHKNILRKYGIVSGCQVSAKAIYAGNNRWKVYEISMN